LVAAFSAISYADTLRCALPAYQIAASPWKKGVRFHFLAASQPLGWRYSAAMSASST
jgi:hypothetical protein